MKSRNCCPSKGKRRTSQKVLSNNSYFCLFGSKSTATLGRVVGERDDFATHNVSHGSSQAPDAEDEGIQSSVATSRKNESDGAYVK